MRKIPLSWHAQIFQITILYASPCLMHQWCIIYSTVRSTMTKMPFVTKSLHFPLPPRSVTVRTNCCTVCTGCTGSTNCKECTCSPPSFVLSRFAIEGFWKKNLSTSIPIGSMYGIFTYIWVIDGVNVGKYSIHGSYGIVYDSYSFPIPISIAKRRFQLRRTLSRGWDDGPN